MRAVVYCWTATLTPQFLIRNKSQLIYQRPQKITLHGHSVAVVISQSMYERLTNNQLTLTAFMQNSPFFGIEETIFEREQTLTRDFEL